MLVKSKVKYIQSLSHKKQRDADKVFVAEGPKIINELLNEPAISPLEIYALKDWIDSAAPLPSTPVEIIDEHVLSRISSLTTPNQVVGLFKMPSWPAFDPEKKLSLLLDNIQDPGNLGTILRCADWFGIEQVVCSLDCADVFSSKVVQSTMGSIGRVKVYYANLIETIKNFNGIRLMAATLNGKDVHQFGAINEGMLLIGNESKGIGPDLLALPHEKITISRKGNAESLNAAVATGILLHELTQ
jgi:TrmH family RNA methyltransferase